MVQALPYDDHAAMRVLKDLDASDLVEIGLMRGAQPNHLALFADWRQMQTMAALSYVLALDASAGGIPFGVLVIGQTQPGVAQAAMLARDHTKYRRPLIQTARRIRNEIPVFAKEAGLHRIEARSWVDHPRANKFLRLCGFTKEAALPGFGPDGRATFNQFAWTNTNPKPPEG